MSEQDERDQATAVPEPLHVAPDQELPDDADYEEADPEDPMGIGSALDDVEDHEHDGG